MLNIITNSDLETKKIAKKMSEFLTNNTIICLNGELGTGKTCFTIGIAEGLKVSSYVSSPTFTIINEYNGVIPLYHFDLYRIDTNEFYDIGGNEYFYKNGVVIMEWPENIKDALPTERLDIEITYLDNNKRNIRFIPYGKKYIELINNLKGEI